MKLVAPWPPLSLQKAIANFAVHDVPPGGKFGSSTEVNNVVSVQLDWHGATSAHWISAVARSSYVPSSVTDEH